MSKDDNRTRREVILKGVKVAIAQALERHRRLGESIAVWRDGKVVVLEADQIPPMQTNSQVQKAKESEIS